MEQMGELEANRQLAKSVFARLPIEIATVQNSMKVYIQHASPVVQFQITYLYI